VKATAGVPRADLAPFGRLAWVTAAATLALVALGAATLAWGAGLSCPDWPLCQGRALPPLSGGVLLEWGHRAGAALVAVLSLAAASAGIRLRKVRGPWFRGSLVALGLLAAQVLLGGLTIFDRLAPWVVVLHAATATALLALWVRLAVAAGRHERPGSARAPAAGGVRLPGAAVPWAAAASGYATLILGSYVAAAGAGLACPDWPLCGAAPAPGGGWLVLLQVGHRLAAALTLALAGWTAVAYRRSSRLAVPAAAGLGLVAGLALLGAALVAGRLAPAIVVVHFAMAAGTVALLTGLATAAAGGDPGAA
jgi:heme A synthase